MNNYATIYNFELKNFVKNKVFIITTVILLLVTIGFTTYPRIKSIMSDGVDKSKKEVVYLELSDKVNKDLIIEPLKKMAPNLEIKIVTDDLSKVQDEIEKMDNISAFKIDSYDNYEHYVKDIKLMDKTKLLLNEVLKQAYQMDRLSKAGLKKGDIQEIVNVNVSSKVISLGKNQVKNFAYTYFLIFLLYTSVIVYGQLIAINIANEKSSRVMEVLITSVRPVQMMVAKIFAAGTAALMQISVILATALISFRLNEEYIGQDSLIRSLLNIPIPILIYMIVFFILGFLIYAFIFGAIGSTVNRVEDVNTAVTPAMLLFIGSFLVVMISLSTGNTGSILMRVASFVPFSSPLAMFTRISMTKVPILEVAISLTILVVSLYAIGIISGKIYRSGVLMYGNKMNIKNVIKALKKA